MIFVTGDTHGSEDFDKLQMFAYRHPELTKQDYVIIAGDFGAIWSEQTLTQDLLRYERLPFTVLFVDGNHENFNLLNKYKVQIWNGGKAHIIASNIIHLMRGQVFTIQDKTFFTFGGATSIDKCYRVENESWWREEVPSEADMQEAKKNLAQYNYQVDYIITHSCDEKMLSNSVFASWLLYAAQSENKLLTYFEENVKYKHWYFGHYHIDRSLPHNKTVLFNEIIALDEDKDETQAA